MKNTFKTIGTFVMIFFILLSMGAGAFAETVEAQPVEENSTNWDTSIKEQESVDEEETIEGEILIELKNVIDTASQPEEQMFQKQGVEEKELGEQEPDDQEPKGQEPEEQESKEQEPEDQTPEVENVEEVAEEETLSDKGLAEATQESEKLEYQADTHAFPLKISSTNDHTRVVLAWMDEGDAYLAVISKNEIKEVRYKENSGELNEVSIKRAQDRNSELIIKNKNNGHITSGTIDEFSNKNNEFNDDYRWSVVKIAGKTFPFELTIEVDKANPHNIDNKTVYIDKLLQVYHKYGEEPPILDRNQSGSLDQENSYIVQTVSDRNDGTSYELDGVEVSYNGEKQNDIKIENIVDGHLEGKVPPKEITGNNENEKFNITSAEIIFIYKEIKKANTGSLTITNTLENAKPGDENKEFDIFIYGSKGRKYTVSLSPGESVTLEGLEYGDYKIQEIMPMNFKAIRGNGVKVKISEDQPDKSVKVINKRTNLGWFYHDHVLKNTFKVGSEDENK